METMKDADGILALLSSGRQVAIGLPEGELSKPVGGCVHVAWLVKEGDGQNLSRFLRHQEIWFRRGATASADLLKELELNDRHPYKVMGVWEVSDFLLDAAKAFETTKALESERRRSSS